MQSHFEFHLYESMEQNGAYYESFLLLPNSSIVISIDEVFDSKMLTSFMEKFIVEVGRKVLGGMHYVNILQINETSVRGTLINY